MTNILKTYFEKENFNVFVSNNSQTTLELFYENNINICILDWMMPNISGIEICKEIKKISACKVIILTAKSENDDELFALETGADDYIRKPFDPRILVARVKKLLENKTLVKIRNLNIDFEAKKVFKDNIDLNLNKKEFELIGCFYNNKGKILSRNRLLDLVWGLDYMGDYRTVDTHINRLRDKIGNDFIKTYRGMGYSFECKDE